MSVVLSSTIMVVDLFVIFMQVKFSAANMWVTIFLGIIHVGVSVAIIQVVFSAVHYKKMKNIMAPFLWIGFNCLKASATSRRQFTFYH